MMSLSCMPSRCFQAPALGNQASGRTTPRRGAALRTLAIREDKNGDWKSASGKVALSAALGAALWWGQPAIAELNQYEAAAG